MGDAGVKVAFFDTGAGGPTPSVVGQIQGTPTIKFFAPKKTKKKTKSNSRKQVTDYNGPREFDALQDFVKTALPSFVTRIAGAKAFEDFVAKADKYGLPKAVLFTRTGGTEPLLKVLSTEFRRRLLVGEIRLSKPNQKLVTQFDGVQAALKKGGKALKNLLMVFPQGSDPVLFEKKFVWRRAAKFLKPYVLAKPYFDDEVALAAVAAAAAARGEDVDAAGKDEGPTKGGKQEL